jgi:ankyrin repeat protein
MKTPLHCAAAQGRKEICKLLIDAGASLNTQDKHCITPLHDCNFKGHFDLFEYLINDSNSEISEIKVEGSEEGEGGTEVTEVEKKKQPIPRGEIIRDILGYSPEDYSGEYKYQEEVNDLEELSIKAERKSSSRSPSRESKRSSSTRPESKQRESRRK